MAEHIMQKYLKASLVRYLLYCCWCFVGLAANAATPQETIKKLRTDGIDVLENNQIPLLNNRFRVDHEVKEITLLFFRNAGTPPVILVKPDGSKMYASLAVIGEAEWFDESTYDLIKIKNPMPGPWQAIGELSQGSKVLIITDFELNVDPLPEILIQGETIKLTGYVTNNGEPIRARNFKDVITLIVDFVSTNNKKYANFGAGVQQVTRFADNGKGFDERPGDGVFTGEFTLNFPSGEWIPKYHIQTPLMTRELENDPIIIHPNPVTLSVETTTVPDEFHKLKIDVSGDYIKPETMVFQGKIYYPNQDIQSFSITENTAGARFFNVINYDYGLYKITISGYGTNANGREFMLEIPDFSFAIDPPPVEDRELPTDEQGNATTDLDLSIQPVAPQPEPEDNSGTIILVVVINIVLALLGWLFVKFFIYGNGIKIKLPKISFKRKAKVAEEDMELADGEEKSNDKKKSKDDDILDLSLSDN